VPPVHGLDGAEAEPGEGRAGKDAADQGGQTGLPLAFGEGQIAAPAAEVDAGEDQFMAPGGDKALDLAKNGSAREAAGEAAGLGNDAKGAAIAAAFLNFEVGPGLGAGGQLRFFEKGVGEPVVGPDGGLAGNPAGGHQGLDADPIGGKRPAAGDRLRGLMQPRLARADLWRAGEAQNDLGHQGLVAVAHHGGDAGQARQFPWLALRIAAGDHDAGRRVEAVGAANEGARGPVGLRRYAAGVDDDDIGFRGLPHRVPRGLQAVAYRLAIGPRRPATEMFHIKSRHPSSLRPGGL